MLATGVCMSKNGLHMNQSIIEQLSATWDELPQSEKLLAGITAGGALYAVTKIPWHKNEFTVDKKGNVTFHTG